jgi:hypothetical protein
MWITAAPSACLPEGTDVFPVNHYTSKSLPADRGSRPFS